MKLFIRPTHLAVWIGSLLLPGLVIGQGFGNRQSSPPEQRAALLKQYDQNADGKLSDAEREVMRKARAEERLRSQSRGGRGGFRPQFPPEIVKIYDKDKDGKLDDTESQSAMEGIRKRWEEVNKQYDKNANGRLDDDESEALNAAMESGKIEGLPRTMFGMRGRRGIGPRGGRRADGPSGGETREAILQQADKDKDGRLNETELLSAREALARQAQGGAPKTKGAN